MRAPTSSGASAVRLAKSVSLTFASRVFGLAIALVISIVLARSLGTANRGVLAIASVISGIVLQFGNLGLHASNVYFAARDEKNAPKILGISLVAAFAGGSLLTLVSLAGTLAFRSVLAPDVPAKYLVYAMLAIPAQFGTLFFSNLLIGRQKILELNVVDVVSSIVGVVALVILLLVFHLGVGAVLIWGLIAGMTSTLILGYMGYRASGNRIAVSRDLFLEMFRYGRRTWLASLFAFLIIRSDMLFVNYFGGATAAGLYSVAVGLVDKIYLVPQVIGSMLFPKVAANPQKEGTLTVLALRVTNTLMLAACVLVGVLSPLAVRYLYGAHWMPSVPMVLVLLPGIFFLSAQSILMQDFAGRGMPPIVIITPAVGLLVNVSANLVVVPRYGAVGASVTSSITYGVMLLLNLWYFTRITGRRASELLLVSPAEARDLLGVVAGGTRNVLRRLRDRLS